MNEMVNNSQFDLKLLAIPRVTLEPLDVALMINYQKTDARMRYNEVYSESSSDEDSVPLSSIKTSHRSSQNSLSKSDFSRVPFVQVERCSVMSSLAYYNKKEKSYGDFNNGIKKGSYYVTDDYSNESFLIKDLEIRLERCDANERYKHSFDPQSARYYPKLSILKISKSKSGLHVVSKVPELNCELCNKEYTSEKKFTKHMKRKHGTDAAPNGIKKKKVRFGEEIIIPHSYDEYECEFTETQLEKSKSKYYECSFCDKKFKDRTFFKMHVSNHKKKCCGFTGACPNCNSDTDEVLNRSKTIAEDFSAVCNICKGSFYNESNFLSHKEICSSSVNGY